MSAVTSPDHKKSTRGFTFAAAPWAALPESQPAWEVGLREIATIALEAGLALSAVTSAEPFVGLREMLEGHIDAERLRGFDWFDQERAVVVANPRNLHETARSVVSLGLPYYQGAIEKPDDVPRGRISRYAWGVDYHRIFKTRLRAFHRLLEEHLGREVESRLLSDTARTSDRAVAVRSGLGWYGKHSCVIVPGYGSWVMLADVIVDVTIERSFSLDRDCGSCSICIDRCPTGAIVAPYVVATPRCLSFQTIEQRGAIPVEIRPLMGDWVFGCDVCQEVCPYTGAAKITNDPDFAPRSIENVFPRLDRLLEMTEAEFREVFARSAVLRAKRRGLARNAAVAMGNSGDDRAPEVLAQVLASHDEPLVRGHAAWALRAIGGGWCRARLDLARSRETDVYVIGEIDAALDR